APGGGGNGGGGGSVWGSGSVARCNPWCRWKRAPRADDTFVAYSLQRDGRLPSSASGTLSRDTVALSRPRDALATAATHVAKEAASMWLVNAALRNPYAVYVGMLLVSVLGLVAYQRTPTDILPQMKMPVVVVFASYRGMPAPDMERSVTAVLERALTRCDHLAHIESRSLLGIGIIHVYFRPQVDPDVATAQVISFVNGEMQFMPPGMLPPTIL